MKKTIKMNLKQKETTTAAQVKSTFKIIGSR